MKDRLHPGLAAALLLCLACVAGGSSTMPLAFESHGAQYVARGAGYAMSIAYDGALLQWDRQSLQMRLAGADSHQRLEGVGRMPGRVTYMLGTTRGATYDLYSQVRCRNVYPGVDVLYRGDQQRLEYDFYLAPRTTVDSIALAFAGASRIDIDTTGDLILHAGTRTVRQPKPQAWQIVAGNRRYVTVEYRKLEGGRIGFHAALYDRALPLVIDPAIIFDTVFGGTGGSAATGLALDSKGNIYVAGSTVSPNFTTVNPVQRQLGTAPMLTSTDGGKTWTAEALGSAVNIDTVVAAPSSPSTLYANADGGVFQSTDSGATWKQPGNYGLTAPLVDVSVDAGSSSTLYGCNSKGVFISSDAGNSWNSSNTGVSVYEGQTGAQCYSIRANPAKPGVAFYMAYNPTGFYRSVDFGKTWTALNTGPAGYSVATIVFTVGAPDSLIAGQLGGAPLLSSDDGDTWTTVGAQSVANNHAFVVDPNNSATWYIANAPGVQRSLDGGKTWTLVLPAPSLASANATVLAIDKSHVYAFDTMGLFVSADQGATWTTAVTPYPVLPGSLYVAPDGSRILLGTESAGDVFVTKWDPTGTLVLYSTYLGGSGGDSASGIAVDSAGSTYVAGNTSSANFPVTANALQKTLAGSRNPFVAKLSPDGSSLVYSTFFGGGTESAAALAVDAAGAVYFAGSVTGGLPVTANAFQKAPGGATCTYQFPFENYPPLGDAFVAKISPDGAALLYASYLGGDCGDRAAGIVATADGSAWVVGTTFSPDFPVTSDALQPKYGGGFGDGFVARISPAGAMAYSTYVGGTDYDEVDALALDAAGTLYLTGSSAGFAQPASAGTFQPVVVTGCIFLGPGGFGIFTPVGNAFVMKLNSSATAVTGLTYIGAPCSTAGSAIAPDPTGGVWIAGVPGLTFPTASPLRIQYGTGVISKLSADLTQLLFSTYSDSIGGLAVSPSGMAYVAGSVGTPVQAYVEQFDPTPAAISLDNVASASPFSSTLNAVGVAPGKIVRLLGKEMGPAVQAGGTVANGAISTTVAGVVVTFDFIPAALLYVSATEIECLVPFETAIQGMTVIRVSYNGAQSNAMQVPVQTSAVEVLTILNEDFTVNSPSTPARAGSIVTLYITGAGQTDPASVDNQINTTPLAMPSGEVTVTNQGVPLPVTFAAAAYGLAPGILQVNFQAPDVTPQGGLAARANGSFGYFTVYVR